MRQGHKTSQLLEPAQCLSSESQARSLNHILKLPADHSLRLFVVSGTFLRLILCIGFLAGYRALQRVCGDLLDMQDVQKYCLRASCYVSMQTFCAVCSMLSLASMSYCEDPEIAAETARLCDSESALAGRPCIQTL